MTGNRIKRKAVSVLLALILMLSSYSFAFGADKDNASATDIQGHWAEKQIHDWMTRGLVTGYKDGTFRPNNPITRAEFIVLVNRSFGFTALSSEVEFSDLKSSDWEYAEVQRAVQAGYISGYKNNTFRPNSEINRQEIAIIIARLLQLELSESGASIFNDASSIPAWSKGSVGAVAQKKIMTGNPDQSFLPANPATRAEALVILDNALKTKHSVFGAAGTYGPATGSQTINGDVEISVAGVTLQNTVINGNLTFGAGIGEGDAFLKHVTVKGTTNVKGGGANSIHIEDSVLLTIVVDKLNGTVRIVAEGSTTVASVLVQSPVTIEQTNAEEGAGFQEVKLTQLLPENSKVTIKGSVANLEVEKKELQVEIQSGSIQKVTVNEMASGSTLTVDKDAKLVLLVLDAAVKMLGQGTIDTAELNVTAKAGTTFETQPKAKEDKKEDKEEEKTNSEKTPTPSPSTNPPANGGNEPGGGGSQPSTDGQAQADRQAADAVAARIAALPAAADITLANETAVNQAKSAYDQLTATQKALVSTANQTKLTDALAKIAELKKIAQDEQAANAVTEQIAALPIVADLKLKDESVVNEVKSAYDKLTATQKALVSTANQTKLTEAVAKIAELKRIAQDEQAANAVSAKIVALPAVANLKLSDESVVNEVNSAYDKLTADQKALVSTANQTKLKDALAKIAELKRIAQDEQAANAVAEKIAALPAVANLKLSDESLVNEANSAYYKLTTDQKALVSTANQTKLKDALAKIAELKRIEQDEQAANAVAEKIAALPAVADLKLTDESVVNEANSAYDKLTADQKALVSTANQTKLKDALAKIAELKRIEQDEQAANAVAEKIVALPAVATLKLTDETAVNEAKAAFDNLTEAQQELVSTENQTKLADAVAKIAELKKIAEQDQQAADAVTEQIIALPAVADLKLTDKAAVVAAKSAFDLLTAAQQVLISATNKTKLADAIAKIEELNKPSSVTSLAITNFDYSTVYGTQARGESNKITSTNFKNNPKQFTISDGTYTIPITLNWDIPLNGFTIGQSVGSAVDSTIQQYFIDRGIDLGKRTLSAVGFSDTFFVSTFKVGSDASVTLGGNDWSYFFGQNQFRGTNNDTSKNRTFTVSDGKTTATILLEWKYVDMSDLVDDLNYQLSTTSVKAVKLDDRQFKLSANSAITIGGANKAEFFAN